MHFHWGLLDDSGSEHTVDNFRTAAEGHFVFQRQSLGRSHAPHRTEDQLAVVGVLYQSAKGGVRLPVSGLTEVIAEGATKRVDKPNFSIRDLIPNDFVYATYKGSLTVPPCNETVDWFVSTDIIGFDVGQLKEMRLLVDSHFRPVAPNYRPLQKQYKRKTYLGRMVFG